MSVKVFEKATEVPYYLLLERNPRDGYYVDNRSGVRYSCVSFSDSNARSLLEKESERFIPAIYEVPSISGSGPFFTFEQFLDHK